VRHEQQGFAISALSLIAAQTTASGVLALTAAVSISVLAPIASVALFATWLPLQHRMLFVFDCQHKPLVSPKRLNTVERLKLAWNRKNGKHFTY